jgi:protein-S-isoprenylcysteine O-methyltransferase Ste14
MKKHQLKIALPVAYFLATLATFGMLLQHTTTPVQKLGMLVAVLSFVCWIVARVQLADNFSIGAKTNQLVTHGLYAKLRHPVYYFSIFALIGISLAVANVWLGWATFVLCILEIFRIRAEEKVLEHKFGEKYIEYKRKTWL